MGDDLFSSVKRFITPDFIKMASALMGENPEKFQSSFLSAIPTLLMGLIKKGSNSEGSRQLMNLIQEEGYESGVPKNYLDYLRGGHVTEKFLHKGTHLLNEIFGDKLTARMAASSGSSSGSPSVIMKIFSLAAPLVMGTLGAKVKEYGLNPSSLMGFLGQQKSSLERLMPQMPQELPEQDFLQSKRDYSESPVSETHEKKRSALPLGLIALALLGGLLMTKGKHKPEMVQSTGQVSEQAGSVAQVPPPSADREELPMAKDTRQIQVDRAAISDQLATFLDNGSDQDLPKRFVFDHLKFYSGKIEMEPGSEKTLDEIAITLKRHPSAVIALESFTDSTGTYASNQKLSQARAEAVKRALLDRGVDATSVRAAGLGASNPLATNETPEGRSLNRRTELLVLHR